MAQCLRIQHHWQQLEEQQLSHLHDLALFQDEFALFILLRLFHSADLPEQQDIWSALARCNPARRITDRQWLKRTYFQPITVLQDVQ